jgi:chromosome segregation ATPase
MRRIPTVRETTMSSSIARWFSGDDTVPKGSHLVDRHANLTEINKTVTEYGELLEQVSTERAHLLKTISELQLKNAELSVGKALFADLESELQSIRKAAADAVVAIDENRTLRRELEQMRHERDTSKGEAARLAQENSTLRGTVTRMKNRRDSDD